MPFMSRTKTTKDTRMFKASRSVVLLTTIASFGLMPGEVSAADLGVTCRELYDSVIKVAITDARLGITQNHTDFCHFTAAYRGQVPDVGVVDAAVETALATATGSDARYAGLVVTTNAGTRSDQLVIAVTRP
jgi:hypothetical protein